MNHYIEVVLQPGTDIDVHFLWKKVFQQVHLALVEQKNDANRTNIGVSFPQYRQWQAEQPASLGSKLRIFAEKPAQLERANIDTWLAKFHDYLQIQTIAEVPNSLQGFARFTRVQSKIQKQRLARRRQKRHGGTYQQALDHYANLSYQPIKLPFIQMESMSSKRRFNVYIKQVQLPSEHTSDFSLYGLSPHATVPLF